MVDESIDVLGKCLVRCVGTAVENIDHLQVWSISIMNAGRKDKATQAPQRHSCRLLHVRILKILFTYDIGRK